MEKEKEKGEKEKEGEESIVKTRVSLQLIPLPYNTSNIESKNINRYISP